MVLKLLGGWGELKQDYLGAGEEDIMNERRPYEEEESMIPTQKEKRVTLVIQTPVKHSFTVQEGL